MTQTADPDNIAILDLDLVEVPNPTYSNIPLNRQITLGSNEWKAVTKTGHEYFGPTKNEAIMIAAAYHPLEECDSPE